MPHPRPVWLVSARPVIGAPPSSRWVGAGLMSLVCGWPERDQRPITRPALPAFSGRGNSVSKIVEFVVRARSRG